MKATLLTQLLVAALGLFVVMSAVGAETPVQKPDLSCGGRTWAGGVTCGQEACEPWCNEPCQRNLERPRTGAATVRLLVQL